MSVGKIASVLSCIAILLVQPGVLAAEVADTKQLTKLAKSENIMAASTPAPMVTPERLAKAIDAIDKLAQKQVDDHVVPGLSISIVHGDKVVYSKGFGVREVNKPEKVNADTVFQLASVSKCITSTVVAALVGEGKVSWDSRINDLDPGFELQDAWVSRQLTIRDLLAHRSGLPEHAGDLLEDIGYPRAHVLHQLRYQKPGSSFRSKWKYTNFGYTEGALAAAKAVDSDWDNLASAKLFKPLGMNSTSTRFADFMNSPDKAFGHILVKGAWVHGPQREPDAQSPAGGVASSANDMAKWLRLQVADGKFDGRQVIDAKALAETHHPQIFTQFNLGNGLPGFYGLGFNVSYDQHGMLQIGHSGAFCMGAATNVTMIPAEGLGICVLTNAYPIGVAEGLAMSFTDMAQHGTASKDWLALFKNVFSNPAVLGIVKGFDYSKPPVSPSAPLSDAAYIGRYTNQFFGDIEVIEKEGALSLVLGPKKMTFPMKHYDRDIFTYHAVTENLDVPGGLRFTIGEDGKAATLLVENLDVAEQGSFKRIAEK